VISLDAASRHGVNGSRSIEAARLVSHGIWLEGMAESPTQVGARGFIYEPYERLTEAVALDACVLTLYVSGRTTMRRVVGQSDEELEVGPGDITLQPPCVETHWSWSDRIQVLQVFIEPSYLCMVARAVTGGDPRSLRMSSGLRVTDDALAEMGFEITRELRSPRPLGAELSARAIGERMVIHLLRHHFEPTESPDPVPGSFSGHQIVEIRDSIASCLGDELPLEKLSKLVGLGRHHFGRVFRRTFGQTPHRYVRERRLERARDLLLSTGVPVGMIAMTTGFSDQSHLTRCFTRHFGIPPAALRKRSAGAQGH